MTLRPPPAPRFVYGLFRPDGKCEYIGSTFYPLGREGWHRNSGLLKRRPKWEFRILFRGCYHDEEFKVIQFYKDRGQARLNTNRYQPRVDPGHRQKCNWSRCRETGMVFYSFGELARFLDVCITTVYNMFNHYGGEHVDLDTGETFHFERI